MHIIGITVVVIINTITPEPLWRFVTKYLFEGQHASYQPPLSITATMTVFGFFMHPLQKIHCLAQTDFRNNHPLFCPTAASHAAGLLNRCTLQLILKTRRNS